MLWTGDVLAEAPTSALAGTITGNPQVYDVVMPVRLLVGEVENCAPLQAILEAVDTTGKGLTVTTKLNGLPIQLPLLGTMVNVAFAPVLTPVKFKFPVMAVSPKRLIFLSPSFKTRPVASVGELQVYVVPCGTGLGVEMKLSLLQATRVCVPKATTGFTLMTILKAEPAQTVVGLGAMV